MPHLADLPMASIDAPSNAATQGDLPLKARFLGRLVASIIRLLSLTVRFRIEDTAGVLANLPTSMIWAFWHNRILAAPVPSRRFLPSRQGAVLTSPSRDGAIIAATMKCFGVDSVRGSSSRRGGPALRELTSWLNSGNDVVITPDGPRGPRYRIQPGLLKLAQITGSPILPVRFLLSSFWSLKSWDRFRIPKPFSTVTMILEPLATIPAGLNETEFAEALSRLEHTLNPDHEID